MNKSIQQALLNLFGRHGTDVVCESSSKLMFDAYKQLETIGLVVMSERSEIPGMFDVRRTLNQITVIKKQFANSSCEA